MNKKIFLEKDAFVGNNQINRSVHTMNLEMLISLIKKISFLGIILIMIFLSVNACTKMVSKGQLSSNQKITESFVAEPFRIYASRNKDNIENTLTMNFCVGETMVFSARSGELRGEGPQLGTNAMQIVIYKLPDERVVTVLERHVAPDWHGTYHEIIPGIDCDILEPGEYKIRFIKVVTRELYAKGSFRVITCDEPLKL
jgi:hypothetical protein